MPAAVGQNGLCTAGWFLGGSMPLSFSTESETGACRPSSDIASGGNQEGGKMDFGETRRTSGCFFEQADQRGGDQIRSVTVGFGISPRIFQEELVPSFKDGQPDVILENRGFVLFSRIKYRCGEPNGLGPNESVDPSQPRRCVLFRGLPAVEPDSRPSRLFLRRIRSRN